MTEDQDLAQILSTVERMLQKLESDEWKQTLIQTVQSIMQGLEVLNKRLEVTEYKLAQLDSQRD